MIISPQEFEVIDFFDAKINDYCILDDSISMTLNDIIMFPSISYDDLKNPKHISCANFVFLGVYSSVRTVYEYIGHPSEGKFKATYHIDDGPFSGDVVNNIYRVDGRSVTPLAWIEWDIRCKTVNMEIASK